MRTVYVSFQPDTARVYPNQTPPEAYPSLKNPDFSKVKGIPMHKWTPEHFTKPSYKPFIRATRGLQALQMAMMGVGLVMGFGLVLTAFKLILGVL